MEAALITPVFLLMVFGILEFGLLFRNNLTTTNASRDGARAASVYGREAETDFLVLQTVRHGVAAMGLDNIDYVVVYRLASPTDAMDPACHTGSVTGVCNRYVRADFDRALDDVNGDPTIYFRCGPLAIDRFWCPADRDTSLASADLVGIYVKTTHKYVTGFFGSEQTLDDSTVIRIEPDAEQ